MIKPIRIGSGKWISIRKFFASIFFTACIVQNVQASERIDALSGTNQAFTLGYQERRFAEGFHLNEAYAPSSIEELLAKDTWQFKKEIAAGVTYDSNLFGARIDPKDDVFYTYSPTLGLKRKGTKSYVESFYTVSYVDYVENQKLSRPNQRSATRLECKTEKLSVYVSNVFEPNTAYATGERTELKSAETSRVTTYADDADVRLNYKITPKTSFDFDYGYRVFYFPIAGNSAAVNSFSSQTHVFTPGVFYRITPKTDVYARYSFEIVDFFQSGGFSSKAMTPTIGVLGRLTPKTSVNASVGYKTREYNDAAVGEFEGPAINAAVSRKFSPKITGTLSYTMNTREDFSRADSQSTDQITEFFGLNLSWFFRPHLTIDGGASAGFNSREGLITKADPENSTLTFTRTEENSFYEWNMNLVWRPRAFAEFFMGYKFFKRSGSFKDFQSDDHRFTVSGVLRF